MQERVSHGSKAATEIARELLRAERGGRLQNPVVRPAVIFVEQLNVIPSHDGSRNLSSVGYYLAPRRYFHYRHIAAQRLSPVKQLVMSRVRRIAKLGVLAGRTLSADRLEINRRKDAVLGLDAPGGSFLEQRYRGLTAARAMKDVNIQVRHDSTPVVEESICLARKKPAAAIAIAHD